MKSKFGYNILKKDRNSIQDLEKIKIKTKFGQLINLNELAEYEYKRGRVVRSSY